MFKQLRLSSSRSTTVASHRGNDERLGTQALDMIDHGARDLANMSNPSAACGDRHRLIRANLLFQLQ